MMAGQAPLRLLVTGAAGQVGWELVRAVAPLGQVHAFDRAGLDLADPVALRRTIRELRPHAILNAAAYTAVDAAEQERELAWRLNAEAPGVLAEEARQIGALLVHYSTDYVFDGTAERAYVEDDTPSPLNAYGASKLAGERAVRDAGGAHLVFRTSWVYGARGRNFVRTMLRLAAEREELRVVDDQRGAPTWSRDIAQATALVLARLATPTGFAADAHAGLYHLAAQGETSWHDLAAAVLAWYAAQPGGRRVRLERTSTADFGAPAPRPRRAVLDSARALETFRVAIPPWRERLACVLEEIGPPPGPHRNHSPTGSSA